MDDEVETDAQSDAPRSLALVLSPTRLSIGPTRALLNWRLDLTNGGDAHLVALRIWSDMDTAHASVPDARQLGGPDMDRARLLTLAMLAPGESASVIGEWQLDRTAMKPVGTPAKPMIVPLARFRILGAGLAPQKRIFVIGSPPANDSERVGALGLEANLQIHSRLAAREIS